MKIYGQRSEHIGYKQWTTNNPNENFCCGFVLDMNRSFELYFKARTSFSRTTHRIAADAWPMFYALSAYRIALVHAATKYMMNSRFRAIDESQWRK